MQSGLEQAEHGRSQLHQAGVPAVDSVGLETRQTGHESMSKLEAAEPADEYPEGGYGWVVVGCVCATSAATWGMNTTYGVYQSFYLQNNYFSGGTPLRYAFVGGLAAGMAFILAPLSNFLSRRYSFRVPMWLGTFFVALGQCLAGLSKNYGTLLALQGIVFGIGLGLTLIPCQPLMAQWFNHRLALAQGLATAGTGLGAVIFSNTTRLAIERLGVRYSLVINGLASLVILAPAVFLMKEHKQVPRGKWEPLQIHFLWHPGFCFVWISGAFAMMGFYITIFTLASYASDGLGLSQTQAAALQSIMAAAQLFGRPLCGLGLDWAGRINTTMVIHALSGISCFAFWLPSRNFALLAVFAFSVGTISGTIWGASTPLARSVVGPKDLSAAMGIYWIAAAPTTAMAFPIAIALLEHQQGDAPFRTANTYTATIALCGTFYLLAAICLIGAKRYVQGSWRIMQKV